MHQRNRRLAVAATATSAIAVIGALGSGIASPRMARADTSGVSFTSVPSSAAIVAHYTVTPTQRGGTSPGGASTGGADSNDQFPDLSKPTGQAPDAPASFTAAAAPATGSGADPSGLDPTTGPAPNTTASFSGMQGSNKICNYFARGCNPPDMAIAASPTWVFQGANSSFEVLSPSGTVQPGWPVTANTFFQVPLATEGDGVTPCDAQHNRTPFMSDPRAFYDPADNRFWAAYLQVQGAFGASPDCKTVKSFYWIAVSQTGDPRGNWNVYQFDMKGATTFVADYTQIGITSNALLFSGNMFNTDPKTAPNDPFYAQIFEANKHQMERGEANFTAMGFKRIFGFGPGVTAANVGPFFADTLQPVSPLTGSQDQGNGSSDAFFLSNNDGPDLLTGHLCTSAADACRGVILWRMSNPTAHDNGGPAPTFSGTLLPDTQPFYTAPRSDQPSCNRCVDSNDLRIPAMVTQRGNTIYTAWDTGINNGTQVVPGIITADVSLGDEGDSSSPSVSNSTLFNFTGDDAASYPALLPRPDGSVLMVYEHMSHATFPEARYTLRGADQSSFTSAGRVLKAGEASYRPTLCGTAALPVCRWGDYEAAGLDGTGRAWLAGQYANTNTDPNVAPAFGRNWGTWMVAIGTSGSD